MTIHDLAVSILAVTLLLSGFWIRFWVGRRQFNRRGLGGLQHYSSYSKSLMVSTFERFANFLSIPLILLGLFIILSWWMYVREINLTAKTKDAIAFWKYKTAPTAHFLVPAEEGCG